MTERIANNERLPAMWIPRRAGMEVLQFGSIQTVQHLRILGSRGANF
jgi:hypothetical protein